MDIDFFQLSKQEIEEPREPHKHWWHNIGESMLDSDGMIFFTEPVTKITSDLDYQMVLTKQRELYALLRRQMWLFEQQKHNNGNSTVVSQWHRSKRTQQATIDNIVWLKRFGLKNSEIARCINESPEFVSKAINTYESLIRDYSEIKKDRAHIWQ